MSIEAAIDSMVSSRLTPYAKFKVALKSKEVQRQYPSLLGKFLDFCKFEGLDIEQKAVKFCDFVKYTVEVDAKRCINSKASKRGGHAELIIRNYA
jgi:hypothetical protein